jgi:murein DD-endopeptidase MepM/ murein hydrolase activator NlpD
MSENIEKMTGKKSIISMIISLIVLLLIGAATIGFYKFYEREKPQFNFKEEVSILGQHNALAFSVADARSGISFVAIVLSQGDKSSTLYEKSFSRQGFFGNNGPHNIDETAVLEPAKLGFTDGAGELRVTVRDFAFWNWMAGNETVMTYPVTIDTHPPQITILHSTRYVSPGGSGIVIYRINDKVEKNGVTINGHFNPGFPVNDAEDDRYIAYFGLDYTTAEIESAAVNATDKAGNSGTAAFGMVLKKQKFGDDQINVSDSFLKLKIPEFAQAYPQLSGSPVEQFVYVNSQVRRENYKKIVEICSNPSPTRLWEGVFERMSRSSRMAGFAEHRTYYYNNEEIDQEVHLGIDLASTKQAEVHAANRGKVVFADYLGIYGNTIILDHGQGVFTLYSHLSAIDSAVGDLKEKGALIGRTGNTGMAGGDHLHFSVLVNGIFVNPIEWWDKQWLQLNIEDILNAGSPKSSNL